MKNIIRCGCGKRSRWRDMPGGKRQVTDLGVLEYRHCSCGSTHTQYIDGGLSSRLKTRRSSKKPRSRQVVTAKDILTRRMLRMRW